MPHFQYSAKEGPNKVVTNIIEADNSDQAIKKIIQLGLTPLDIFPASAQTLTASEKKAAPKVAFTFFKAVSLSDLVVFTRQMSDLIEASVPILRTLQLVTNQTQNPRFKKIVEELTASVRDGQSFSSALARYPTIFSSLYINMVKTGEVSGKLNLVMTRLADYLEKQKDTRGKIIASLSYPILIMFVGVLTVFVLLTFVIPKLSVMFEDFDQKLPLPTIILMNVSSFFAHFWWAIIFGFVLTGVYLKRLLQTPLGKERLDTFLLKLPFLGDFFRVIEVAQFTRTLGTLVESGVVITSALNSVYYVVDNTVFKREVKKIADEVTNGRSLKAALRNTTFFPERAVNMISVGEETGELSRGLNKVADIFEREADQVIKTLVSLLGPIVLILIVSVVGCVVIALLLPILQMNTIV
jgi:general secretion pathway protein F